MRAKTLLVVAIGLLASTLVGTRPAWACSCIATSERTNFKKASAVFVGVVTATRREPQPSAAGAAEVQARFSVDEVYKGDVPETVVVATAGSGSLCGVDFVPGTRYAVFTSNSIARGYETTTCSGTETDLTVVRKAGAREPIKRYHGAPPPQPLAQDGPGVSEHRSPRSGPMAAAAVLLLTAAAGTFWAYRSGFGRTGRGAAGGS